MLRVIIEAIRALPLLVSSNNQYRTLVFLSRLERSHNSARIQQGVFWQQLWTGSGRSTLRFPNTIAVTIQLQSDMVLVPQLLEALGRPDGKGVRREGAKYSMRSSWVNA